MDEKEYGVHQTHCCALHGCKYGDEDCPVFEEKIKQEYLCEFCSDDGIKSLEELFVKLETGSIPLTPQDIQMTVTIKEAVKEELGNQGGFYDGEWNVIEMNYREQSLSLNNGRVTIFREFGEVDIKLFVKGEQIQ